MKHNILRRDIVDGKGRERSGVTESVVVLARGCNYGIGNDTKGEHTEMWN